ncbi:NAD(P)/FAD-dependent oxidoreductase [Halomonas cupida]|uniref:NAD(P)/FAD-dependent oxidoreductase n=1 Tax=Halomonas cupida TaxID=44933 RepID=UPI003A8EC205
MQVSPSSGGLSGNDADIAIIGAGVIGTACALMLSRRGFRVLVIDQNDPGMGASWGNAGHMATEQIFPIADASILKRLPGMLMDPLGPLRLDWRYFPRAIPWFSRLLWNLRKTPYRKTVTGIRALNQSSLSAWRALLASIDHSHLLKDQGSFLIHERADTRHDIDALHTRMLEQQVNVEHWQGDAIRQLAPQLSQRIRGGLFFPDTAHVVNPWRVVNAMVEAARHNGVQFTRNEVLTGKVDDQGVTLQTSESGQIRAHKVVLSCGAHSASLAKALAGVRVPLDTERGYHLMLPGEQNRLPVAVTSLERRFIMTPMEEGLRLAGTVEFAGLKQPPNMQRAWQLHRLSQGLFKTELDAGSATAWMGFRPSLPDSLPIIDSVKDGKVLLAFGHHHLGLTQAAVTAEIITQLATDGETPATFPLPDLEYYKANRFA